MAGDSGQEGAAAFESIVAEATKLKEKYVDSSSRWYFDHRQAPFVLFRGSGVLLIILSAALPAMATAEFPHKTLTLACVSVAVAVLAGLNSFFRWERTWRSRVDARLALNQLTAKWELEIATARVMIPSAERVARVYTATDDLLTGVRSVLAAEQETFFSNLQFPQTDKSSRP